MKTLFVHYGPGDPSLTTQIVESIRPVLQEKSELIEVDLANEIPPIFDPVMMQAYVKRNYKGQDITEEELQSLLQMDKLADQVLEADKLIMVFPTYNFNVPAAIKAWIDSIAQAKKLFRYGEYGPEGLANIENAMVINVTGSTPQNSKRDFVTPYMEVFLKFIGVKQVKFEGIYGSKFLDRESHVEKISIIKQSVSSFLSK